MHSSRMRTGRSLTVCCCSVLTGGGGGAWSGGVLLAPGGWDWGAWSQGGGAWSRGGVLLGPGGVLQRPPPVNRITDTCKNITLATTSLRPVKIQPYHMFHGPNHNLPESVRNWHFCFTKSMKNQLNCWRTVLKDHVSRIHGKSITMTNRVIRLEPHSVRSANFVPIYWIKLNKNFMFKKWN